MAKITLDTITSSFASTSLFNTNFSDLATELNDKVLYRNNPGGEANQMENDLDMNSNDILNCDALTATSITLNGTPISPTPVTVTASAVTYDNTTSGLTATNVQTALDERVVDFDAHIVDAVDAHDASAISNVASGNLVATEVQAALNELQTELDSATSGVASNDTQLARGNNHGKNFLINADFSVNQEAVSGTVVLASGVYGHDMMKAGSSGCTYTFATSAGITTITISAGTLQQVVEATHLPAIAVVLSWTGTAQGKIDSGSFGASGTVTDTTTGGTNVTVEFDTGTLSQIQLEGGSIATDFEFVTPADQLARCKRHFERDIHLLGSRVAVSQAQSTTSAFGEYRYLAKRAVPTITQSGSGSLSTLTATGGDGGGTVAFATIGTDSCRLDATGATGLAAGNAVAIHSITNTTNIDIDARL